MDRLPCELLFHILRYIGQALDLIHMSYVCRRWQSFIMDDEYFLNRWFSRSLEHFRKTYWFGCASYSSACQLPLPFDIDLSLFPINLRSSKCEFLPWTDSKHSCEYEFLFEYDYPLSLFESSHSFSFWLFLPDKYELNIQIGNFKDDGVAIVLNADKNYHFDKENRVSIADRWIHVVLNRIDSHRYYQIWIDGQYVPKFNQYYLYFSKVQQDDFCINMVLFHKFDNNTLEPSNKPRIADLNAITRCLTLVEIRAIYHQQTSIDQVKVGTFIYQQQQNIQHQT